ncbi:MAG: type II secretion system protein GspM [Mariprofundus sp.]|nr:type II secretion system protein GspM [Mariprofundus sp.]
MINTLLDQLKQSVQIHLMPRYQQLERSEQKILLLASIVLPLMIIVFGIMLPLQDKQHTLQQAVHIAQSQATEAKQLASYLNTHAKASRSNDKVESLLTTVERLARQSKVRSFISRIKPQTSPNATQQHLMLRLKNVPYAAALRFIHALAEQQLNLKSMKIQSTSAAGIVNLYAIISGT